jgi:hypothetical protein
MARSRGLGDVYKRQDRSYPSDHFQIVLTFISL